MKTIFRPILPAMALVTVVLIMGMGRESRPKRIFLSSFMTMHDPFFVSLNEGFRKAVNGHGDSLVFLDGEHSRDKQEKDILDMLNQDVAGIFLVPATDRGSIDGILAAAKKKGVPVILVDTDMEVPDSLVLCKVLTDNVGAGRMSCDALAKVNPRAKVGILSFSLSKGCVDRVNGFREAMAKYPGMSIIGMQDGHANKDGVNGVIKDFLARTPDMDAIFAINDVSALAANSGIEAAGRKGKITVQGVAGSSEGAQAIKDGNMFSSCAQMPMEIGRVAVETAYQHIAGKKVPGEIRVPVRLVTKENADQFIRN